LNYKWFLLAGLLVGFVPGIVLGGTLLAGYFRHSENPSTPVVRSIFNATLVLDPGNGTRDTLFVEHLTPLQPINVTVMMNGGNFTAGVDFSIFGPCSSGQCALLKDYRLDSTQRRVSFVLDRSTTGFQPGEYQIELFSFSSTIVATVYVNLGQV